MFGFVKQTINSILIKVVATKAFQRLILQLDRSDGRPDIPINSLADKYATYEIL